MAVSQSSSARSATTSSGELNLMNSSGVKNLITGSDGFSVWGFIECVPCRRPWIWLVVGQCVRTAARVWRAPLDAAISASLYRLRQSTVRGEIRATHDDILPCLSPHFSLGLRDGRSFDHRTICPKTCLENLRLGWGRRCRRLFLCLCHALPGPASRQPLIVSNRPHRLTLVRADLHENPNRSAKKKIFAGWAVPPYEDWGIGFSSRSDDQLFDLSRVSRALLLFLCVAPLVGVVVCAAPVRLSP